MFKKEKTLQERWQKALKDIAKIFGVKNFGKKESQLARLIQNYSLKRHLKDKKNKTKFVILTGPSGVGKNEIAKHLRKKIIRLPHVTSRTPRAGEKEGREYFFISKKQFKKRIKDGRFLAYRETYGDYRGVSKDHFLKYLDEKKLFFIERTIPALLEFKKLPLIKKTPFLNVYILPSSFSDLKKRIAGRTKKDNSLDLAAIENRLTQAVEHLETLVKKSSKKNPLYKLFLVNPHAKNKKEIKKTAKKIAETIDRAIR